MRSRRMADDRIVFYPVKRSRRRLLRVVLFIDRSAKQHRIPRSLSPPPPTLFSRHVGKGFSVSIRFYRAPDTVPVSYSGCGRQTRLSAKPTRVKWSPTHPSRGDQRERERYEHTKYVPAIATRSRRKTVFKFCQEFKSTAIIYRCILFAIVRWRIHMKIADWYNL